MSRPFTPDPSCQDPVESPSLVPVDDARKALLASIVPVGETRDVALADATGRVLAVDVFSTLNVPAHDNSAMDGYAVAGSVLASDRFVSLDIVGEAWAGRPFEGELKPGEAVKIATGAIIPTGADTVVIQERVRVDGTVLTVPEGERAGANVRLAGEDTRSGDCALTAGTRLHASEIGYLASIGVQRVSVFRPLRVALFSTGDELVPLESGRTLGAGEVFDSNRHSLRAALASLGVEVRDLGIVKDDAGSTESVFHTAAQDADAVIATGGASVSDADHVAATLRKIGDVTFWRVAMRPGRPLATGQVGRARFFGLPGNPVATMVSYYQFVLPALKRQMGCANVFPPSFKVRCRSALKKSLGRVEYQRGIWSVEGGEPVVHSTGRQGAGRMRSMVEANCFIVLSPDQAEVAPGDWVEVQPFEALI